MELKLIDWVNTQIEILVKLISEDPSSFYHGNLSFAKTLKERIEMEAQMSLSF